MNVSAAILSAFAPNGRLRASINLGNPIHHAIMAIIAIVFGICTYIKESRKGNE